MGTENMPGEPMQRQRRLTLCVSVLEKQDLSWDLETKHEDTVPWGSCLCVLC